MKDFKIQVFEDEESDITDIKLYISELNEKLSLFEIKVIDNYSNLNNAKVEIKKCETDLIILDLIDDKSNKPLGKDAIKHNEKKIPTLIYTNKAGKIGFDIDAQKDKYKFLLDLLIKSSAGGDNLINYLYSYILSHNKGSLCFTPYSEHDLALMLSLESLGLNRINNIIAQVNDELSLSNPSIFPMTLGFSGAILFKLKYETYECVIKLSKDIDKIKKEHENAKKLYKKFPDRLLNYIEYKEYYSFDKEVLGFLMKSVNNSVTLFEYILNTDNFNDINNKLNDLFLNPQGLKYHYNNNKGAAFDWTSIFQKINGIKYLLISKSYEEVRPLIEEYYENIQIEDFRRLAITNDFENLSKHNLLDEKYKTEQVLAHGDFHAKNIMIQDNVYVKIIDTGLIGYTNWSSDISRLIVDLFINGVDYCLVDFFKVNSIEKYINILEKIMNCEKVPLDGKNDNVITAINWLALNAQNIFDSFKLFEYQLGLMKEFIQMSYRIDTIPANRRAFSLIAADILMKEASNNVK